MKRIKNNISILAIIASTAFTSCEYDDINQDPTRPGGESVEIGSLVPAMQTQTHRNMEAALGRHAGIIMQHWEGNDAQQVSFTSYQIGEGGKGSQSIWEGGFYTGSMRDAADVIKRATESNDLNTRGVAKIYMALNLGMATNTWGNVPYSEAFLGEENLSPSYDSQEEIYIELQNLLTEAITDLQADDPAGIKGSLVDGSKEQWIKTAHALKARFYIQQTSVRNDVAQLALDELALATGSNAEQLNFYFEDTQNGGHPLASFGMDRYNTLIIGSFFEDLMENDPRKNLYMVENAGGEMLFFDHDNSELFWAQLGSPSPVVSYSETKFIEAEAELRTGGNAIEPLHEAIRANMEFLGVPAEEITDYITSINLSGSLEDDLQTIITEKYKAMYGQNTIEAWNDYRRTGYPVLTPHPDGANGNNPSGIIPRRLLYPLSERLGNPEAYQEAIDAQGGHLLDDDIWVFPR